MPMTRAVATIMGNVWRARQPGPRALTPPGARGPLLTARASPHLSPNTVWIAWYILESLLYLVDIRNF